MHSEPYRSQQFIAKQFGPSSNWVSHLDLCKHKQKHQITLITLPSCPGFNRCSSKIPFGILCQSSETFQTLATKNKKPCNKCAQMKKINVTKAWATLICLKCDRLALGLENNLSDFCWFWQSTVIACTWVRYPSRWTWHRISKGQILNAVRKWNNSYQLEVEQTLCN